MLSRTILRASAAPRQAIARRTFASAPEAGKVRSAFTYPADPAAGAAYIALEEATVKHSAGSGELWRKISIFVVAPIVALTAYHVWNVESAHFEHLAAHPRKPDDELPAEYDYQNVRNSKYVQLSSCFYLHLFLDLFIYSFFEFILTLILGTSGVMATRLFSGTTSTTTRRRLKHSFILISLIHYYIFSYYLFFLYIRIEKNDFIFLFPIYQGSLIVISIYQCNKSVQYTTKTK